MRALLETRRHDSHRRLSCVLSSAALCAMVLTGCSNDGPEDRGSTADSGPLTTSLDSGGNSIFPPRGAGETWEATFGSLLICSPDQVTLTEVVPHYKVGKPTSIDFLVRTVPESGARSGRARHWAPVGTATESPTQLAQSGKLRYTTLVEVDNADVDQPCKDDPDASFTEILTTLTSDAGGTWIDHLDVKYDANDKPYSMPVNWSYVTCGRLIVNSDVC
jgi:hypothetical protein